MSSADPSVDVGANPAHATKAHLAAAPFAQAMVRRLLLVAFSHRFLALARWDLHFLLLRLRNAVTLRHIVLSRFLARRARPVYLNFGSGPRGLSIDNWLNVDGFRDRNVHFRLDLSRRLPVPEASFDGIFCEHVLEHFTQEEGLRIAKELLRVLRPGGCIRIIIPDAEQILRWYFERPDLLVAGEKPDIPAVGRGSRTPMEAVNSYFRQRYEHQFMYDWQTLSQDLESAGFVNVARRAFRSGGVPALSTLDDPIYSAQSLYAEATKPGQ